MLAGPGASRIIAGQPSDARRMKLTHVLAEDDGFLFFRYLTAAQRHPTVASRAASGTQRRAG